MSQSKQHDNAPSMMLIMRSVAEAAGMTTADIMVNGRRAGLCHARAAVYKIASRYGYEKDDIMFFLGRNRTVAYNYETKLKGHLLRDAGFKALCDAADGLLRKYPYRVDKVQQRPRKQPTGQSEEPCHEQEPVFTDWKGQLGWTFTAEECRMEWYAKRSAEKYMKTYEKESRSRIASRQTRRKGPVEMKTAEAAVYLGISTGILVKGVQLGKLHRFKKPHDTSYWYHTEELDSYRACLEQNKRIKPQS